MSASFPVRTVLKKALAFLRGDLTKRTMLFVLLPLIFVFYFGLLGVATLLYPTTYDWRKNSVSQLLYAQDNPAFHYISSLGFVISGIAMIPFAGYIRRRLRDVAPVAATAGAVSYFVGSICLALAGVITSHPAHGVARFPHLHDLIARRSVIGIGLGMVLFDACATKAYLWPVPGKPLLRCALVLSWNLLALSLILVVVLWIMIRNFLPHSGPIYHVISTSIVWKIGFWERIGSPVPFLFLICAILFLPEEPQ